MSYRDYQFKETTKQFIALNKFVEPTPIQQKVIPIASKGRDVIGISATGTGKTHAFLIPIMELVDSSIQQVQAVITAPTRELAVQLFERAKLMSEADSNLQVKLITGGMEKSKMSEGLKVQPQIVIGTPGRIKDLFLNEQTLRLDNVKILVVDEADMTLEFGFLEDIDMIASRMRNDLQMLSFSATIPVGLRPFLKKYMKNPQTIALEKEFDQKPNIEHVLIPCRHRSYEEMLMELLPAFSPYICLIFANTRELAANVAQRMRDDGYGVIELHGDLSPRERTKAMKQIMNIDKAYVVATDIAARGIDIDGVSHVVSLGIPKEIDYYIHRSGRTARNGKDGICYALYQSEDESLIKALQIKGIGFHHRALKNGNWSELTPKNAKKVKKDDPMEKEIGKIVKRKNTQVKPGYKVKRKAEVDKLKRKAKRTMIQDDIRRQKKERAKAKSIEKRGDGE